MVEYLGAHEEGNSKQQTKDELSDLMMPLFGKNIAAIISPP
jgi:hypothetical protein